MDLRTSKNEGFLYITYGLLHIERVFSFCVCKNKGVQAPSNVFFFLFCVGLHVLHFYQVRNLSNAEDIHQALPRLSC